MSGQAGVNPVAAGAVVVGLVFVWSGMKGSQITKTFQSLLQGQQPDPSNAYPVSTPSGGTGSSGSNDSLAGTGGTDAAGGTVAQNKAIGKQLAASYGWDTGAQWDALVWVWDHESGWDNKAKNPSSGAYGIPQALPGSKMGAAANPPTSSASAQIKWGLSYIKSRYGDPVKTKAFWQSHNWY